MRRGEGAPGSCRPGKWARQKEWDRFAQVAHTGQGTRRRQGREGNGQGAAHARQGRGDLAAAEAAPDEFGKLLADIDCTGWVNRSL